jgi:ferredoxin-NADP reductase
MKRYTIKGSKAENGILYLSLAPDNDRDKLKFFAGQYAAIGFKTPSGKRSPMRCFSIVSSPLDNSSIQFAIRILGKFTTALSEMPIGSAMYVQGPFGEFVVDEKLDKNLVFIAGGIGITPCMSMIRTLSLKQSPIPMTLLHSYRTINIPFRNEIKLLKKTNPKLRAYHFVTKEPVPPSEADMLSGMIREDHIKKVTSGVYSGSTYFLCGPKSFMDAMEQLLIANGATEDRIITETFTQSSKVYFGSGYSVQKLTYAFAGSLLVVAIMGVSYLDLSRYVPRAASADTKTITVNPSNSSSGSSSSSNSSINSSSNNSSDSSQSQQTYQAPVTSVS